MKNRGKCLHDESQNNIWDVGVHNIWMMGGGRGAKGGKAILSNETTLLFP